MVSKAKKNKTKSDASTIAVNRKARYDYFIEETFETGITLQGWEVKSIRSGRVNVAESYVVIRRGEIWLLGAHISPLDSASTHIEPDPIRTRKLLLHQKEIEKLIGRVERRGYTLVPLTMYWKKHLVKLKIALGKGKQQRDKRATIKEREWKREQAQSLKKYKLD
jgi:SsrA-binding protein